VAFSGMKEHGKSLGELKTAMDAIFNHPIKGFGVLGEYAEKRLTHATGVGRGKIQVRVPANLADAAAIYEKYTLELAKASDFLLRKHGSAITDRQQEVERLADIAVDLFVGLCVLSRSIALSSMPGGAGEQAVLIARVFAQQAKRRMAMNVRRIMRNEDEEMNRLAGFLLSGEAYPWDVMS